MRALAICTLGNKYLHLVKNIFEENIKGGQTTSIVYNYVPTVQKMNEDTKWFFQIIIIPTLFSFYHGIELTMKGLLTLLPEYNPKTTHSLTNLLQDFKNNYQMQEEIINILEKYIVVEQMPPYLKNWFLKHKNNIDDYYDFLKYPFDAKFVKSYDYFDLKYDLDDENKGINLSESILADVKSFLPKTVELYRSIK